MGHTPLAAQKERMSSVPKRKRATLPTKDARRPLSKSTFASLRHEPGRVYCIKSFEPRVT